MYQFMKSAIKEGEKAYKAGEVPIGAIIVKEGKVIARAHNLKETKNNPTAHAEILAIQKAAKKLGTWRLEDCEIYVTIEPCVMCAGAILQSRIERLIFGAREPKFGGVASIVNILDNPKFNHRVEIIEGILEEECSRLIKDFFKDLRKK
ncbi:MAG TPA: nucleoside deaminase [Eubacteriaceae bacterium]|jgi:tRNA(adenine34) deaminase|nr:nucleoside deaminase [Eubacteriaceae bacterium]